MLDHFHCYTSGFLLFRIIEGPTTQVAAFLSWKCSERAPGWRERFSVVYDFLARFGWKAFR